MHRLGLVAGLAFLVISASAFAQPQREGKPRFALNTGGHTGMVRTVAFSPGSDRVYSGGDDKVAYGWEIRDRGRRIRRIDAVVAQSLRWQISRGLRGVIYALGASPTDRRLAIGGVSGADANGDIVIYDTAAGQVETFLDGHRQTITALEFSPDGSRLASMSADGELRIWTAPAAAGAPWISQLLQPARSVTSEYQPLTFLNNRLLAVAAPADPAGAVWNVAVFDLAAPGAAPRVLAQPHARAITALAADPQAGRWASADLAGNVFVWQGDGAAPPQLLRQGRLALDLCFGAGDQVFVATKLDAGQNPSSYIELYSAATGDLLDAAATGADADNFACAVSPDRRFLATCGDSLTPVLLFPLTDAQGAPIPTPLSKPPFGKVALRGEGEPMGKVAFTADNSHRLGVGGISKVLFNNYGDVEYVFDSTRSDLRPVGEANARFLSPETGNRGWQLAAVGEGERKFHLDFYFGARRPEALLY
jgi:WD40 repeat protein